MASRDEWADAYREQAVRDFKAALAVQDKEPTVFAMLLQMTFEKASKAVILRSKHAEIQCARRSHRAATVLIATMKRHERRRIKIPVSPDVAEVIRELEDHTPALAKDGPCLEYPWERPDGSVGRTSQIALVAKLSNPRSTLLIRLLHFARALVEQTADGI